MSELQPVRGLIVDDQEAYRIVVAEAFEKEGGIVVVTAGSLLDVKDLVDTSKITPDLIDVAFLDSSLGSSMGDGKECYRYLNMHGFVRRDIGLHPSPEQLSDPHNTGRIVTVGTSSDKKWSVEIGTYSDILDHPLIVDWTISPFSLAQIVSEVRRLKPRH